MLPVSEVKTEVALMCSRKMLEQRVQPGGSGEERSGASLRAPSAVARVSLRIVVCTARELSLPYHPGGTR